MRIKVTMPNHYYVAFSYGGDHLNSDMLVLKANSTASAFYDMYSVGFGEPILDTLANSYSGSATYSTLTDTVTFSVSRYLNTNSD